MATLLFKLKGVPDDEADEVRALLTKHQIDFYETPSSIWGVSMEAIWLKDDSHLEQAKALLADYQQQRLQQAREQQQRQSLWDKFRDDPLQFIIFMALIALILYFSIKPFLSLGTGQ